MVALAVILIGVSVWVEWVLMHSEIPIVSPIIQWLYREKYRAVIASIGLSTFLGSLFGAAGLICFIGGIGSTFVIQPLYAAERRGDIERFHQKKDSLRRQIIDNKNLITKRWRQGLAIAKLLIAPIYFTFKALFWVLDHISYTKEV